MYTNALQLAEAVLRLPDRPIDEKIDFDIELAAAVLAVHVCDWHIETDLGRRNAAQIEAPFQVRSATGQHRRHGGVSGGGKGRGQGL